MDRPRRLPVPPPSHRANQRAAGPSRSATAVLDRPTSPVPAIELDLDLHLDANHDRRRRPLMVSPPDQAMATIPREATSGRPRRLAQIATIVVTVTVAAGLAIALPNDRSGESAAGSTTRVEADGPTASASLLASDDRLEIDGELADAGGLARPAGVPPLLADPTGSVAIDTAEMTNMIEPGAGTDQGANSGRPNPSAAPAAAPPASTTTTAAWVEPTLSPASEWVDAGHGVMVPDLLLRIRFCESTNDYLAASRSSTARGAYQFLTGSWEWYGHAGRTGVAQAHLASPAQQDEAALATLQAEGTGPWSESRRCWADPDIDPRYATASPPTTAAPTTTASTTTTTTDSSGSSETTTSDQTSSTDATSTTTVDSSTPTP